CSAPVNGQRQPDQSRPKRARSCQPFHPHSFGKKSAPRQYATTIKIASGRKLLNDLPENSDLGNESQGEEDGPKVWNPGPVDDGMCQSRYRRARVWTGINVVPPSIAFGSAAYFEFQEVFPGHCCPNVRIGSFATEPVDLACRSMSAAL